MAACAICAKRCNNQGSTTSSRTWSSATSICPDAACPSARTRKNMRSPSQRSSSTLSTGTLAAARERPPLSRFAASSRPSRCGIETTSGADIAKIPFVTTHVVGMRANGREGAFYGVAKAELCEFPQVSPADQSDNAPGGLRRLNVYRHDYPDYSDYCAARRLQWYRRRAVLWHRLLWRWRPRTDHHHPDHSAADGTALGSVSCRNAVTATAKTVITRESG